MEIKRQTIVNGSNNARRFGAFFLDAVIVAMLSMLVFACAGAPAFGYYSTAGDLSSVDSSLLANVAQTHLLSSTTSIAPSDADEEAMGKSWVGNLSSQSYFADRDCLRYYVVDYKAAPPNNYVSLMLRSEDNYSYSYLFEESSPDILSIKANYKNLVHEYSAGLNTGAEQQGAYNVVLSAFKVTYEKLWVEFGKTDQYLPLYQEHLNLNAKIMHEAAWASLVSYLCSSLFLYIVIPLLNRNGQTIAKRALGLAVVSDVNKLSVGQVISRALIETMEFSFLTIFAPFFFIQTNVIMLSFAGSGLWAFNMFTLCLSSLLLCLVSGALALFSKTKKSLHDFATFTSVVEKSSLDLIAKAKQEEEEKALVGQEDETGEHE